MNNGYYYQLLASLVQTGGQFTLPRALKDVVKAGDLDDVKSTEDLIVKEATECSLVENNGGIYFTALASSALHFALFRRDFDRFREVAEMMAKRMDNVLAAGLDPNTREAWIKYIDFAVAAAKRLTRVITVEEFERILDEIEWPDFERSFTARVCSLVGLVYQAEEGADRRQKARFWLLKSYGDSEGIAVMSSASLLVDFLVSDLSADSMRRLDDMLRSFEESARRESDASIQALFRAQLVDLNARTAVAKSLLGDPSDEDDDSRFEIGSQTVRDQSRRLEGQKLPGFVVGSLKLAFADAYLSISNDEGLDRDDASDLVAAALDELKEAATIAKKSKDLALAEQARLRILSVNIRQGGKTVEKEVKELLTEARKGDNMPHLVTVSRLASDYYRGQKNGSLKAFEVLFDLVKRGQKRLTEGGYYLVIQGMKSINLIVNREVTRPGVTWMIKELDGYFSAIMDAIESVDNHLAHLGATMFATLEEEYLNFEPATHFSIKTYLRYQFYEVKVLRLSAVVNEHPTAQRVAEKLIAELSSENNPLTFIRAAWAEGEFKEVPNSVRNKVVNKCISISKGDLPLAADHLNFSYRNLRSYITFKEVNRLGFFLDEQQTTNRQLEQGIRLMFFDLYKNGTIFEVVFDMPKFLVEHSKSGFSSQDLEEALDIKGTTAKKYIKIMMEIGLIKHERSVGRKHFYKLRKDNVMSRLGKEAKVVTA